MNLPLTPWYDFRDLSGLSSEISGWVGADWLGSIISGVLGALGILMIIGPVLLGLIWLERKVISRFQQRYGPNRVGPKGLLQPVADAVKLVLKEELRPRAADKFLFLLPPILVFIPGILVWGVIPFGPNMQIADLNVGVLFLLAISSTAVVAIFIAGWSSNNKYALFGSMRVIAMSISYEVPMVLSLLTIVFFTGSMSLNGIVQWQQSEDLILILLLPMTAFTFFFAATAELNRTPMDISEAESEIVAGYHTEYSGMRFGLFYAVELLNTFGISAFVATFFLGGWWLWGLDEWIPSWLILLAKTGAVYFIFIWLRGTLPRLRLDQMMNFCWKFLVPSGLLFLVAAAVERTLLIERGWDASIALPVFGVINFAMMGVAIFAWAKASGTPEQRLPSTALMARGRLGGLRAAQAISRQEAGAFEDFGAEPAGGD
jgi:NADH-quinone oxidoreductase subunit H